MSAPQRKAATPRRARLTVVPENPPPKPAVKAAQKLSRVASKRGGRSEMSEALAAMPAEFIVCREDRHHWQPFTARPAANKTFERVRRCASCTATKWTLLNSSFRVIDERPIDYPEGYLLQGLGRLTGDDRTVVRGINFMREMHRDDAINPRNA